MELDAASTRRTGQHPPQRLALVRAHGSSLARLRHPHAVFRWPIHATTRARRATLTSRLFACDAARTQVHPTGRLRLLPSAVGQARIRHSPAESGRRAYLCNVSRREEAAVLAGALLARSSGYVLTFCFYHGFCLPLPFPQPPLSPRPCASDCAATTARHALSA